MLALKPPRIVNSVVEGPGAIITSGAFLFLFALAIPECRWVLSGALPIGIVLALVLHYTRPTGFPDILLGRTAAILASLGLVALLALSLPETRWMLLITLPPGIAIAVALHYAHRS